MGEFMILNGQVCQNFISINWYFYICYLLILPECIVCRIIVCDELLILASMMCKLPSGN